MGLFWALGGVAVAALIGIVDKVVLVKDQKGRGWFLLFYLVALVAAGGGAIEQARSARESQRDLQGRLETAENQRSQAESQLENLEELTTFIHSTVGDIGRLNDLTGDRSYYVRIAAAEKRAELKPYLDRIEAQFGGASSSGLVTILDARPGSKMFHLAFGRHLNIVAAFGFKQLADAHRFPPGGDHAAIVPEVESDRPRQK